VPLWYNYLFSLLHSLVCFFNLLSTFQSNQIQSVRKFVLEERSIIIALSSSSNILLNSYQILFHDIAVEVLTCIHPKDNVYALERGWTESQDVAFENHPVYIRWLARFGNNVYALERGWTESQDVAFENHPVYIRWLARFGIFPRRAWNFLQRAVQSLIWTSLFYFTVLWSWCTKLVTSRVPKGRWRAANQAIALA
jgi:hypothetical protein